MCANRFTWSILLEEKDRTSAHDNVDCQSGRLSSPTVKLQDAHRNCVESAAVSLKGEEGGENGVKVLQGGWSSRVWGERDIPRHGAQLGVLKLVGVGAWYTTQPIFDRS